MKFKFILYSPWSLVTSKPSLGRRALGFGDLGFRVWIGLGAACVRHPVHSGVFLLAEGTVVVCWRHCSDHTHSRKHRRRPLGPFFFWGGGGAT